MVSEPIDDARLAELPWTDREGFVEASNFIVFGRLTAENRLLIGGGPAPYRYGRNMDERHIHDGRVEQALRREFARYFPGWDDVRFTHSYGGCIAITRDYVPHIGELAPGVFYGYGYCGNGIACTHAASKSLRDLVLEQDTNYSNLLFVRGKERGFPPEPLSYVGAGALSRLLAWQDRHPAVIKRQLV
jgi:glycine/D-amino acid oxidase-like deaminating enzyme